MIRITKPTPENARKQHDENRRRVRLRRYNEALKEIGDVDDYDAFDFYESFIADAGDR